MTLLLEAALKISLVIGLGLIAAALFQRRSAALRHWVLATATAGALATPALMGLAPTWSLPVAAQSDRQVRATETASARGRVAITTAFEATPDATGRPATSADRAAILLTIWIAGVLLNLSGLMVGFWRLSRTAMRATVVHDGPWVDAVRSLSEHFDLRTPVRLLQGDRPALLVTWGVLRPKVMLPVDAPSWGADRIRVVLAHELAHVQRRDWIVQIGSELLRIANWFNPLVWFAASRLRLESERACDDAVVSLGVSGRDYAEHLLDLARQFGRAGRVSFPAVAIVPRSSSLERRVAAMLNPRLSRYPLSVTTRFGTIAALLAIALPIALFTQNRFSTLSGSVMDPSGGLLPGVTVVATDITRGVRHEVLTSRTGQFEIVGLPEGPHALEATLPGFQKFQQKLTLDGQDMNRDITLRVGTLMETISVTRGSDPPSFEGKRFSPQPADCNASAAGRGRDATGTLRIGGQIRQPTKIRHVSPAYPEGSSSGVVILEAVIGPDGLVVDVKVLRTPAPELSLSAENAVRQWEFTPTLLNCVAVPVIMTVTVNFS
jgi:beta-lactamase regulating signal transducer with metallopeptidase domain